MDFSAMFDHRETKMCRRTSSSGQEPMAACGETVANLPMSRRVRATWQTRGTINSDSGY